MATKGTMIRARRPAALMLLAGLTALGMVGDAEASSMDVGYFVGRDNNATVGGAPNPNAGRLTMLFNHGNHFHSIGRVGGPEGRLPEAYIGGAIKMWGSHTMGYRTSPYSDPADRTSEYSSLEIRDIHDLAGYPPGSPESILYNSSNRRWSTLSLDGGLIAFEIVQISAGLKLGSRDGSQVASAVGERLILGDGSGFAMPFQFFTDPGTVRFGDQVSALLRLVDVRPTGTPYESSGNFRFVLRAVPEPSSSLLVGLGLAGGGAWFGLQRRGAIGGWLHRRGRLGILA